MAQADVKCTQQTITAQLELQSWPLTSIKGKSGVGNVTRRGAVLSFYLVKSFVPYFHGLFSQVFHLPLVEMLILSAYL